MTELTPTLVGGRPVVVLHVTECPTGGVPAAIDAIRRLTPHVDHRVLTLPLRQHHGDRGTTDAAAVPDGVRARLGRYREWCAQVLQRAAEVEPDFVHLHSSYAGALGRVMARRIKAKVIYSPHCFAFVREDLARPVRMIIKVLETIALARTDVLYAVSDREAAALGRACSALRVRVVEGFNVASVPSSAIENRWSAPQPSLGVVGIGRVGPQKGSDWFADVAAAVEGRAPGEFRFTWIGSGDPAAEMELVRRGVAVTGWLGPQGVSEQLEASAVHLHTAAWEAFPVSVMDAAAAGLPLVIRNMPSLPALLAPYARDTVVSLTARILELRSEGERREAKEASRDLARRASEDRLGAVLADLYETT